MAEETDRRVVVVDGSNLATEGRTTPSLQQLDEAVRAFAEEDPDAEIVVVVDATFEHRIDRSERAQLTEAELHGEVVSPPAGAIGRGDAFVLRIAERTGARVLSNDSFQEFHAQHPWLFDEGRLVGGKPVPGVGWIFTPRRPVRGPTSKEVVGKARRAAAAASTLSAPRKAAELAKAARKAEQRAAKVAAAADGTAPKIGDVRRLGDGRAEASAAATKAKRGGAAIAADVLAEELTGEPAAAPTATRARAKKSAMAAKKETAKKQAAKKETAKKQAAKKEAAKKVPGKKQAAKKAPAKKEAAKEGADETTAAPAPTAAKRVATTKAAKQVAEEKPAKKASATKQAAKRAPAKKAAAKQVPTRKASPKKPAKGAGSTTAAQKRLEAEPAAPEERAVPTAAGTPGGAGRAPGRDDPVVRRAIDEAIAEVVTRPSEEAEGGDAKKDSRADHDGKKNGKKDGKKNGKKQARGDGPSAKKRSRSRGTPPPAVNEPRAFIAFVASYPLASELEGEVAAFTSHGAMVEVELPGGGALHCYIPLSGMGDPPPVKARQVLARGERRSFVLVGLDPLRRVAELALPGTSSASSASSTPSSSS